MAEEAPATYQVRGVIKQVKLEKKTAIIEHEEIPGYMEAMVMPLRARDEKELAALKPGDHVIFRLNVTEEKDWIDQVKVTRSASGQEAAAAPLPDLRPLEAGQPFPDAELIDDQGQPLPLKSYRGQALALTFIYTRCPIPTYCPRLNQHFLKVQEILAADDKAPKNWRLLSVSIDPERDTSEFLASFAAGLKADPARWRFATASKRELTVLGLKSGLRFWDDRGLIQHNLRTLVINPDGTVRGIWSESDWTPEQLAQSLREAAASTE